MPTMLLSTGALHCFSNYNNGTYLKLPALSNHLSLTLNPLLRAAFTISIDLPEMKSI